VLVKKVSSNMNTDRERREPDLSDLLMSSDEHLGQIGRAYSDWLDFERKSLPQEIDNAVDEITEQYDKLVTNIYFLVKQIRQIKDN
jgi:hypothetical protein